MHNFFNEIYKYVPFISFFFFEAAKNFNWWPRQSRTSRYSRKIWCSNLWVGNRCFPGMTLAVMLEGVIKLFWRSARPLLSQLAWYTWLQRIQSQWLWVSIYSLWIPADVCQRFLTWAKRRRALQQRLPCFSDVGPEWALRGLENSESARQSFR